MAIRPDAHEMVDFLNSLLTYDPYAVAELIATRVPCNQLLGDHPTVQVQANGSVYQAPGQLRVGLLGILNGFYGAVDSAGPLSGYGAITAVYDKDAEGQMRLIEFKLITNENIE